MAERVLIDTGPIVAILCREDAEHQRCVEHLTTLDAELYTSWPVISEAVFLLDRRPDRVNSLLQMLITRAIRCVNLGTEEEVTPWLIHFYERFGEHAPDLADAALMYLAERDHVRRIFTLDLVDFSIYRTADNRALEIIGPVE
jgi:predicted nucleic acid-binding protein